MLLREVDETTPEMRITKRITKAGSRAALEFIFTEGGETTGRGGGLDTFDVNVEAIRSPNAL